MSGLLFFSNDSISFQFIFGTVIDQVTDVFIVDLHVAKQLGFVFGCESFGRFKLGGNFIVNQKIGVISDGKSIFISADEC